MSDEQQETKNPDELNLDELEEKLGDLDDEVREQILNELDALYQQRERMAGQFQQIIDAQNANRPPHEVEQVPVEDRMCPVPPQAEAHLCGARPPRGSPGARAPTPRV